MRAIAIREDIRDLILDATERLLIRYGYAKMTMDDLAQEVGVAKGTLYLHFPSKEEVVLSRIDRMVDRLIGELREIAASRREPVSKLREMLITRVLVPLRQRETSTRRASTRCSPRSARDCSRGASGTSRSRRACSRSCSRKGSLRARSRSATETRRAVADPRHQLPAPRRPHRQTARPPCARSRRKSPTSRRC